MQGLWVWSLISQGVKIPHASGPKAKNTKRSNTVTNSIKIQKQNVQTNSRIHKKLPQVSVEGLQGSRGWETGGSRTSHWNPFCCVYFHFSKLQNIIKLQESVQPTHIQLYPTERIIITQASLKPGSRNNTEYSPLREKLTEWECPAQ